MGPGMERALYYWMAERSSRPPHPSFCGFCASGMSEKKSK
ncbi:hypothetical protein HMPREF1502_0353 [Klebsiella sp. AS10]|nr:hypothetical protein HMPREF1502_0353 [Klebsiella sp. AS10]